MSPTGAKVRSSVAWIAGRRETKFLKPIDDITLGVMASHWAVTKVNAEVASRVLTQGLSPQPEGEVDAGGATSLHGRVFGRRTIIQIF